MTQDNAKRVEEITKSIQASLEYASPGSTLERDVIKAGLQSLIQQTREEEKQRWLSGGVCHSCGEDMTDSKGLSDTCGKCFESE